MKNLKSWAVAVLTVGVAGFSVNVRATAIRMDLTTPFIQPPVFMDQNSAPLATNSLAMLFWTASQNFNGFNNVDPAVPTGDNIRLAAFSTTGGGVPAPGHITNLNYTNVSYASADYGVNLPSGYVYVATFNLAYTTYQSIGVPAGTFYSLAPLQPFNVINRPDATGWDDVGAAMTAGGTYTMTANTIPEPGTMVLFAIGSVAFLGLRRRFARS